METFCQLLIKKSAKKRKIEEGEYLEDADVFFPARGGDDEEVVTWNFANCSEPSKKTQNIPNFKVLKYIFGVSQSLATQTFIKVIRVLILNLRDERIKLHSSEEEWVQECKSFIENYEFPCIGAWDGFHVNIIH